MITASKIDRGQSSEGSCHNEIDYSYKIQFRTMYNMEIECIYTTWSALAEVCALRVLVVQLGSYLTEFYNFNRDNPKIKRVRWSSFKNK